MAIFTRQKVFFEQKVVFSFNFYHKKVPKKHSAELKIRNKNLMICPNIHTETLPPKLTLKKVFLKLNKRNEKVQFNRKTL